MSSQTATQPNQQCTQNGCRRPVTHVLYWPGKVPPPVYCREHAEQAKRIAASMGFEVETVKVDD